MSDTGFATVRLSPSTGATVVADRAPGLPPALVYLHGLTSVRVGEKSEAVFALARARGHAAWRFDLRGHGDSSGTLADTTLLDLIADTRAVLERSGPAFLIGSSLGGLVAAWTAAIHPDLVLGLTLLAPAFRFLPRLRTRLTTDGRLVVPHGDAELHFSPHVLEDFARHDETEMAHRVTAPVLIAHGALDDTVSVAASEEFLARVPHRRKELWVIVDGDHSLNGHIDEILARAAAFHGFSAVDRVDAPARTRHTRGRP